MPCTNAICIVWLGDIVDSQLDPKDVVANVARLELRISEVRKSQSQE